ncbi:lysophospholipid acyltransferase family protein [bacterium]|nr:lysophospholipid acyltransferase family protein [bacterium]
MNILTAIFQTLIRGLIYLLGWTPRWLCLKKGACLGRLAYAIMPERAGIARDNLQLVYGERINQQDKQRMAGKNFAHLGEILLEAIHVAGHPRVLGKFLHIEGREYLDQAVAQGQGVVVFSAHLGNFVLLAAGLAQVCNLKVIFRESSDRKVSRLYAWFRKRLGVKVIADNPRHLCAYHAYSHLKAGGVLAILIDQVETGGVYVDFMGHPAGSTLGAANLALKGRAPLLPAFCIRQPDQSLKLSIGPEFVIQREGTPEDIAKEAVAAMNKLVGTRVREYPTQWFWGHRRWRAWRK